MYKFSIRKITVIFNKAYKFSNKKPQAEILSKLIHLTLIIIPLTHEKFSKIHQQCNPKPKKVNPYKTVRLILITLDPIRASTARLSPKHKQINLIKFNKENPYKEIIKIINPNHHTRSILIIKIPIIIQ